jgi:hypothetical protein
MGLYERLLGLDPLPKIPIHQFQAIFAEFGRSVINGAQAQTVINHVSGEPLTPAEAAEATTLLATVTGSATNRLARVKVIDDVLLLAETGAPGYSTPAEVKTRLGV